MTGKDDNGENVNRKTIDHLGKWSIEGSINN